MKRTIFCLFVFMVVGFSASAQYNNLSKKETYSLLVKNTVSTKKVQELYPPRFSFYSYPLETRKSYTFNKPNRRKASGKTPEILNIAGHALNALFADVSSRQ